MKTTNDTRILDLILTGEDLNEIISGHKNTVEVNAEVSLYQVHRVHLRAEDEETFVSARITNIDFSTERNILTIRPEAIMF